MKTRMSFAIFLFLTLVVAGSHYDVMAQSATMEARDANLANLSSASSSVRWEVRTSYSSATLTVSAPDGRVFSQELKAGAAPEFAIMDKEGNRLPDGNYTYELRLTPLLSKQSRESLVAERGKDDDAEIVRSTRKRSPLAEAPQVQSGHFSILNGTIFVPGAIEEGQSQPVSKVTAPLRPNATTQAAMTKLRQHHLAARLMPDNVIADDLIVQGSACVGFDCVNGEVFGFDTIRLKENNTRLQFDDTSTTAGFPTNNWQIRANSSASGGASFLAFVDQGATGNSETGTIVFEVDAGAPANSLKVASTGRVGLRTAVPVLDLHVATTNTPGHRLEQTSAGGFTAQTWDIAANEANFFVRDVTGGSRLPFRIRPGAPTSSIDVAATGSVGVGTASPDGLQVAVAVSETARGVDNVRLGVAGGTPRLIFEDAASATQHQMDNFGGLFRIFRPGTVSMVIDGSGNVGMGTSSPTDTLSVSGTASKTGGGSWAVFSDERLKTIKGHFNSGLKALMQLQPLRYQYHPDNALGLKSEAEYVGFGAQAVKKVIPEAVTRSSNGYLQVNNDPILWTMLNAIKEQQKQIEQLQGEIKQLRRASRRRR